MFFKLGVLKKSAKKVAGATSLKRDSSTGVFWEYCKVFKNSFLQNTSGGCFYLCFKPYHNNVLFLQSLLNYVPTCLRTLNYCVPTCLKLLRAHVPTCLRALIFHVPTCLHFLRAYVLTYVYIYFFMLTCLRALNYFAPTCAHF